jgi:uracil-DNA glycosylase
MGVSEKEFYHEDVFAIVPMGFCYPGKGKSGDLPPRPECAPAWHKLLEEQMPKLELKILIGQYAIDYYLGPRKKRTLTETVKAFREYFPEIIVLPHPSPRNNIWLKKNEWFERDVIPPLQSRIKEFLRGT